MMELRKRKRGLKVTIETTVMSVLLLILIFYIRRGYLLRGIPEITSLQNLPSDTVVIDARDYNVSYKSPIIGAINIPHAYLQRYIYEITTKKVIVVAESIVSRNYVMLYLRRKGFMVIGFYDMVEARDNTNFSSAICNGIT